MLLSFSLFIRVLDWPTDPPTEEWPTPSPDWPKPKVHPTWPTPSEDWPNFPSTATTTPYEPSSVPSFEPTSPGKSNKTTTIVLATVIPGVVIIGAVIAFVIIHKKRVHKLENASTYIGLL